MTALPPAEEKARSVRDMFDRIAPRYDRVNRILTGRFDQRWRRSLARRLDVGPGDVVLDLACGTGDFAEIARDAGATVYGLDFSRGMLDRARERQLDNITFVQGDAEAMPFPNDAFSVVVAGFALRNFVSIPVVLDELRRVMQPGGRLGFLEVDRPRNPLLRRGHHLYFDHVVPCVGGILAGDRPAYRYLPQSAVYLPPDRELAAMLKDAGFVDYRKRRHMGGAIQTIRAVRS